MDIMRATQTINSFFRHYCFFRCSFALTDICFVSQGCQVQPATGVCIKNLVLFSERKRVLNWGAFHSSLKIREDS